MTEGRAFGIAASAASLRIGAGRFLPVVTGMVNHNAVMVDDLYITRCIFIPLAAAGAYIVCFVSVLCAGGILGGNRSHAVSVTQCISDDVITFSTLLRCCLGCCCAGSMSRFVLLVVAQRALMPVTGLVAAPCSCIVVFTVGCAVPSGSTDLIAVFAIIVVLLYTLAVCAGAGNIVCGIFNLLGEAVIAGGGAGVILIGCLSVIFRIGVAAGACVPVHIVLRAF